MATINKWDILDHPNVAWNPHKKQEEIVSSNTRNRVVSAGRRFGKSEIGGHELIPECFLAYAQQQKLKQDGKRREFWIVGPEYSDAEKEFRVIYNALNRLEVPFDRPGTYYDAIGGNLHISAFGGVFQVHGKSAKHPETLVGEGLNGVILAEAAKLKESVWTKYIRPTLADYSGWSLLTSTPEGKNWFYNYWGMGKNPKRIDWASWRCPSWLNPYVYRKPTSTSDVDFLLDALYSREYAGMSANEIIRQCNLRVDDEVVSLVEDLTPEAFNQEIGAKFTEFVGRVFKEFDEEIHVGDFSYRPDWETVGAVDYGFTNPSVWLLIQIGTWGEVRVIDELYESGLTAVEFANMIKARGLCPSSVRTFYPDPASPGDTKQLESILKIRHSGSTGGELKPRLDAIRYALKPRPKHLPDGHPDKLPQIMIDRRCKMLIHEMNEYRYPERKGQAVDLNNPEMPMKKDDHAPEALGRFFAGKFGTPDRIAGRAKVRSARMRG